MATARSQAQELGRKGLVKLFGESGTNVSLDLATLDKDRARQL
jgi:hypothetical protein